MLDLILTHNKLPQWSRIFEKLMVPLLVMNSMYDILPVSSRSTLILSSHLPLGLPRGFYYKTNPTHYSTNAFHSGCHVCVSISITTYIKESSKYTVSLFVWYRFLQVCDCTVTSHNLADRRMYKVFWMGCKGQSSPWKWPRRDVEV